MLQKQELLNIQGGSITASMINAIFDGLQKIFDFGRTIGSMLNRHYTNRRC